MLLLTSILHFLLVFQFLALVVDAQIECIEDFGSNIQRRDCLDAARALFAIASREDLGNYDTDDRVFSRQGNGPLKFQMPHGYSYATCSIGIDLLDSRTRISNWALLRRHMYALIDHCVGEPNSFIGGSLEVDGFVFVVINPTQLQVRGTCLESRPRHEWNLAWCVEAALEGQRLGQAFDAGREQRVNRNTALDSRLRPIIEGSESFEGRGSFGGSGSFEGSGLFEGSGSWSDVLEQGRRIQVEDITDYGRQKVGEPSPSDLHLPTSPPSLES